MWLLLVLGFGHFAALSAPPPLTWQRWEHTLSSKKVYAAPYQTVAIRAEFSGPDGVSFSTWGFWEKGKTFKIRAAFPRAGKRKWRTTCSDKKNKSLHGRRGTVVVSSYEGRNPLYQHGFLKVNADKRSLVHADDTPFLWMGDTGWHTLRMSTAEEWKKYIDNRVDKGFTATQVHVMSSSEVVHNVAGEMPFENDAPNPAFWKNLEEKIEYANQNGMVVYIVGLGVSGKGAYLAAMNSQRFARYITGTLAGNFVIFSPSMDARYDERNDELGTFLDEADDLHLISQHVGTNFPAAEEYHSKEYLDFTSLQTGHHRGNIDRAYDAARAWSLLLWNKNPVKLVIDTEGMYDGRGNNEGDNWREKDVRKIGWLSWLSGALGYTYGGGKGPDKLIGSKGGVWLLNKDKDSYDYWEKAMEWNSAHQMSYMKKFFQSIGWWRLQPAAELIVNQASDSATRMAAAKSFEGDLLVAYLPDNSHIELDISSLTPGLHGTWFSPVSGDVFPAKEELNKDRCKIFRRPREGDWVLLLNGEGLKE
jgi:hypothetical protein